jgi:hypothetical protein
MKVHASLWRMRMMLHACGRVFDLDQKQVGAAGRGRRKGERLDDCAAFITFGFLM